MFSLNVRKRVHSVFKLKTTLAVLFLLLISLAFANFFLLISLRTDVWNQPGSLIKSPFFIHVYRNDSTFPQEGRGKRNPHKSTEMNANKADMAAVNTSKRSSKAGLLKKSLERRKSRGRRISKTHSTVKHLSSIKAGISSKDKVRTYSTVKHLSSIKAGISSKDKVTTKSKHQRVLQFTTNGVNDNCTAWCRRGNALKPPYFLTAVLLVRIYRHDLAKLSSREMIQWLAYLRYAGVQHVYIYDAYVTPDESQRDVIEPFVQSGFATYIDWSVHNPYTIQGTQVAAYQDCVEKFGKESKWQAAIDIDEYPFSPRDLNENFMTRFLEEYSKNSADVSEITMQNYLFLGKPMDDEIEPLLIARIRRRTPKPANPLVKPIYKPAAIASAQVHHNGVKSGHSRDSPDMMLRMNHYWGARLQDWGEDTPKIIDITEPDYTIEPIVERIKRCADCLGKKDLYQTRWA